MEKVPETTRRLLIVGVALAVIGTIAWAFQLTGGLLSGSNMTNIFLWGLMIAIFAFLVGFGAGSQLVATMIYLFGRDDLKPLARTAAACGFACVAGAGVAILTDLGALRNILAMIFGLNLRSPLAWDMIAISAFVVCSLIQLIMMMLDSKSVKVWATIAGICAIAMQVVEGLLFSTQTSHTWWASPIMPVDFLAVAFVSGFALMMLIAAVQKLPAGSIAWLGRICAIAIAVHLVLALADLCLVFAEGTPTAGGVLAALGSNILLYLCELMLPAIAMVMLFTVGKGGQKKYAIIASILTILGIFAHRLMLLYPAYDAPSLYLQLSGTDFTTGAYPISTGRYLDWDMTFGVTAPYFPSGLEWLAVLMPIGIAIVVALVILLILNKFGRYHDGKVAEGAEPIKTVEVAETTETVVGS